MSGEGGDTMHLVVDVGNTESVVGLFAPGSLEPNRVWRYSTATPRTADELLLLLRAFLGQARVGEAGTGEPGTGETGTREAGTREAGTREAGTREAGTREAGAGGDGAPRIVRATVGSVVPAQTDLLRAALGRLVQGAVHVVGGAVGGTRLPIRLDVEEPRTVGADRIVNTLAAAHLYAKDTVVVDLGTATTYDCITADGVFMGGVIAPGLQSGQEWLASRTAKLPRVELQPPVRVIGRRTEACLQSGIFYGAVDAMDGIVRRILEEWGRPEALVVGTGGLAPVLVPHSSTVHRVEPWLTLIGLELAGAHFEAMADGSVAAPRLRG